MAYLLSRQLRTVAPLYLACAGLLSPLGISLSSAAPHPSPPLTLAQATIAPTLWVNPERGQDQSGQGSAQSPLKTITYALQNARPGTIIQLSAGTYNSASGERFPLLVKPGITLQGTPDTQGKEVVIQGGGFFLSRTSARQNVAILASNQSTIRGVTVSNANPRGYGIWVESTAPKIQSNTFTQNTHDGISVAGAGAALIENNLFIQNGASGISVFGTSQPIIQNNTFEDTGFGINVVGKSTPNIQQNIIRANQDGIVVQGSSQPIIRGNTIENSKRDGIVAISLSLPNLGTSGEPGQNIFRNNQRFDVNNSTRNTIPAYGNKWITNRFNGAVSTTGMGSQTAISTTSTPPSPPPISRSTSTLPPLPTPTTTASASTTGLPVPSMPPTGYGSNLSLNSVAPPPVVNSLRYRVVVSADTWETQNQVRQLVPGAFRTQAQGRTMMQVGAFSDLDKANELAQQLLSSGLQAQVESYN